MTMAAAAGRAGRSISRSGWSLSAFWLRPTASAGGLRGFSTGVVMSGCVRHCGGRRIRPDLLVYFAACASDRRRSLDCSLMPANLNDLLGGVSVRFGAGLDTASLLTASHESAREVVLCRA